MTLQLVRASRPDIYNYMDYRKYLRDFYSFKKLGNKDFSFNVFARLAGMTQSLLKAVVNGRRSLQEDLIGPISQVCKLTAEEADFFRLLVLWNQCEEEMAKKLYFDQISARTPKSGLYILQEMEIDFVRRWYAPTILEMIRLSDFENNVDWIHGRLSGQISTIEIRETLDLFSALGLTKIEGGKLVLTNQSVISRNTEIPSEVIRAYHQQHIPQACRAIQEVSPKDRQILSTSFAVSRAEMETIRTRLAEVQMEITESVDDQTKKEDVYELNIQFFPATKRVAI